MRTTWRDRVISDLSQYKEICAERRRTWVGTASAFSCTLFDFGYKSLMGANYHYPRQEIVQELEEAVKFAESDEYDDRLYQAYMGCFEKLKNEVDTELCKIMTKTVLEIQYHHVHEGGVYVKLKKYFLEETYLNESVNETYAIVIRAMVRKFISEYREAERRVKGEEEIGIIEALLKVGRGIGRELDNDVGKVASSIAEEALEIHAKSSSKRANRILELFKSEDELISLLIDLMPKVRVEVHGLVRDFDFKSAIEVGEKFATQMLDCSVYHNLNTTDSSSSVIQNMIEIFQSIRADAVSGRFNWIARKYSTRKVRKKVKMQGFCVDSASGVRAYYVPKGISHQEFSLISFVDGNPPSGLSYELIEKGKIFCYFRRKIVEEVIDSSFRATAVRGCVFGAIEKCTDTAKLNKLKKELEDLLNEYKDDLMDDKILLDLECIENLTRVLIELFSDRLFYLDLKNENRVHIAYTFRAKGNLNRRKTARLLENPKLEDATKGCPNGVHLSEMQSTISAFIHRVLVGANRNCVNSN